MKYWGIEVHFGPLGIIFNLYSAIVAILVIVYSLHGYTRLSGEMKVKIRSFLIGIFIFVIANLIFNVGAQVFFQSVQYQFLGDFSSIFLLGFTAYATVQYKLFDVQVLTTEALTLFLLIILFSRIFVVESETERLISVLIFILTMAFGFFLFEVSQREVKQREQLSILNKRLEELDKQKDEFLNVASHELRAPLTAIKGYIAMVRAGDAGQVAKEVLDYLNEAYTETDRMIRLVNNMLNVARIEEGRMVYEPGEVSLSTVVNRVYNEFKFEAGAKSLGYTIKLASPLNDKVVVDVDRIHEVAANLINNAIKYTDTGQVEVRLLNPSADKIRFEVQDTGPGMTPSEVSKLFNKFYRAESYVGKKMGTGLGLYISKLLVQKFGGQIGVQSQKGKGSLFWFELPLKK